VVKADGYGHGAVAVARALTAARAGAGFGVSLVEEGVALRDAGVMAPVLVMGPSQHGGEDDMGMAGGGAGGGRAPGHGGACGGRGGVRWMGTSRSIRGWAGSGSPRPRRQGSRRRPGARGSRSSD